MRLRPVLVLLLACLSAACGGSPAEDLCQAACDCTSACTDASLDACIDQIEGARDIADEAGCGSEMDTYIECVAAADGICEDPQLGSVCTSERDAVSSCGGAG